MYWTAFLSCSIPFKHSLLNNVDIGQAELSNYAWSFRSGMLWRILISKCGRIGAALTHVSRSHRYGLVLCLGIASGSPVPRHGA